MPNQTGIIKDTLTGLFCTSYNFDVALCQWGNTNDAVEFPTLQNAQDAAADMNTQLQTDRFIGQNPPKPR